MPDDFTSATSKGNSTQKNTLDPASPMEQALYDQLSGLAGQQSTSLGSQNIRQQAMMDPTQALRQLNQMPGQTERQAHMRQMFGNEWIDRFNAGGGTGQGVSAESFQRYQDEAAKLSGGSAAHAIANLDSPDFRNQLEQQIAQQQVHRQATQQQLNRLNNPYGLTPEEQASIGQVYDNQREQARYNMNLGVQDMATSRGLNVYDAPVSNELARQMMLMESNLGAAQAGDLLNRGEANRNYGLNLVNQNANLNQMGFNNNMMLNQMTPGANQALLQPLLQQRMAQGTMTGSSSQSNTPSMFDTIMKGVGTVGGLALGGAMGMGGMGAMGGAGGAGGLNLASGIGTMGAGQTNYAGGLAGYNQGGSNFLVNAPKF